MTVAPVPTDLSGRIALVIDTPIRACANALPSEVDGKETDQSACLTAQTVSVDGGNVLR